MEVDREQILHTIFRLGFAYCRLDGGVLAWMLWSYIDEDLLGIKSLEELYPSPPLGVCIEDTSQLPKEKNLHGLFK
jgi:hypothetical protein